MAPSLDQLLDMSEDDIAHLSIGTLKAVLFQNHVNARLVVEKAELVAKVRTLVEDERRERERHAAMEAAERAAEEAYNRTQHQTLTTAAESAQVASCSGLSWKDIYIRSLIKFHHVLHFKIIYIFIFFLYVSYQILYNSFDAEIFILYEVHINLLP